MPRKNKDKVLVENTYYHAYNRGYNKQNVFLDNADYLTFIYLIKKYLDPKFEVKKQLPNGEKITILPPKLDTEVELHAYCLMPNHFHLLLYQKTARGMPNLISRLLSSYTSYFNSKYNKTESIWQGTYRAVAIRGEEQFLHISRYIHANPFELTNDVQKYPYSSLLYYINGNVPIWLKTEQVLNYFGKNYKHNYLQFIQNYTDMKKDSKEAQDSFNLVNNVTLD